jgi:hypothetical protein
MKTSLLEELALAGFRLSGAEMPAVLKKRHLGREVAAFANFNTIVPRQEIDKIGTSITAGACEPEGFGHGGCVCP